MSRKLLDTHVTLPPGAPSEDVVREFLRLAFEEFRWFQPMWYGFGNLDKKINPDRIDYEVLLGFYRRMRALCVTAKKDDDFFLLMHPKEDEPRHAGDLVWVTPARRAQKAEWRAAHREQVVALMRLFDSPLAYAATSEDLEAKTRRWVPQKVGQRLDFTVRDYSEGLAGLFWRNFYGPPFVRLFGERLRALPVEYVTELGEQRVLVQPYGLPEEAGSEAARERERQLITLLGPECFYDHERHQKPTHLPELPP